MMATPSRNTRMPSSAVAVNVTLPPPNWKRPVHRTEKKSTGRPLGPPAPQSMAIVVSHAVRVAGAVSVMLLKYSAKNWPVGHGVPLPGSMRAMMALELPTSDAWYAWTVGYDADDVLPVR